MLKFSAIRSVTFTVLREHFQSDSFGSMKAANIQDALHQKRFKPFDLNLDSGASIRVKHPDCVLFSESKNTAVIADGERFHIIDLEHISSLSYESKN